ncbi:MAG: hypothetical protein ABR912_08280 [Terracidiphilus sp.]|jgi:hypothetical protein
MTTERNAGQILGGETLELALRVNGMGDEEAALVLDARMCILEDQWKRSFVERGLILLEFEERDLWSLLKDPDTDQPYPSLRKWIKRIAPASFRDCYAALAAVKELRDMRVEDLLLIPRCNIEQLKLMSPTDRAREIEIEDGKRVSVISAAQTMKQKEFSAEIGKRFHLKSPDSNRGRLLGEFIDFRGLKHEPVNEQGVVFLFGMVARELGFVVEIVRTSFPDCEAKRRVGKDRWEKVKIEFEFRSRNFFTHGHDESSCDVIVCWENNWPDCPLEVIELSAEILRLDSTS